MARKEFDSTGYDHRAFSRRHVLIAASIREQGGGRHIVEVIDLSQAGFRMRSASFLISVRPVFLTLPNYTPLKARIAWNVDNIYGCEFDQRLHEAVFEDILKRYPHLDANIHRS